MYSDTQCSMPPAHRKPLIPFRYAKSAGPLFIGFCCLSFSTPQADQHRMTGADLYKNFNCAECHGADGKGDPKDQFPSLVGLDAGRIYDRTIQIGLLNAHESAVEDCGVPPSSQEIREIAAYLATLPNHD